MFEGFKRRKADANGAKWLLPLQNCVTVSLLGGEKHAKGPKQLKVEDPKPISYFSNVWVGVKIEALIKVQTHKNMMIMIY